MWREVMVAVLAVGVVAGLGADEPAEEPKDDPLRLYQTPRQDEPKMPTPWFRGYAYRPVKDYVPQPDDDAVLYVDYNRVALTKDATDLLTLISLAAKNETRSITRMVGDDKAGFATNGTRVKVLLRGKYAYRGQDFYACRVMILNGPYRNQTAYTASEFVVRLEKVELTPTEKIMREIQEREDKKLEDGQKHRAATMLRTAENLAKAGKTKAALDTLQEVIKVAPDTPEAKAAVRRIGELKGK